MISKECYFCKKQIDNLIFIKEDSILSHVECYENESTSKQHKNILINAETVDFREWNSF